MLNPFPEEKTRRENGSVKIQKIAASLLPEIGRPLVAIIEINDCTNLHLESKSASKCRSPLHASSAEVPLSLSPNLGSL